MEMSQEIGTFDAIVEDVATLRSAIAGSSDLRRLLASPVIDVRRKESIIHAILEGKVSDLMMRFVTLLTSKGRSADLPEIVVAFDRLLDVERNQVRVEIRTAISLDVAQKKAIEEHLASISKRSVRPSWVVDQSIIGGFQARFDDTMVDASVRHQLDRLHESFMQGSLN
jgi:F-type H+-transporting ATPase subunit delta